MLLEMEVYDEPQNDFLHLRMKDFHTEVPCFQLPSAYE